MDGHRRSALIAMAAAGLLTAQFVSGKATRDAMFLVSVDFTALPAMLVATAVCSILLVALNARGSRLLAPSRLVPASFVASGVLFIVQSLASLRAPAATAITVYLHVSGLGPLLASGFWLIVTERFDPRTAKKKFGQIAGSGTLGGLLGAFVAERVAALFGAAAMLPVLAALQFLTAWLVFILASESERKGSPAASRDHTTTAVSRSGLRLVVERPYLRDLAALVLLGTTGAAVIEYLLKARAVEVLGRGDDLLRFFAVYYAVTSLITFVLQTSMSRVVLERCGLALTTSTPSGALIAAGIGSLVFPGLGGLILARGSEAVLRGSLFRTGYELFYTPIPASEKRAAKSIIDVGFDRLGDAAGGGLVRAAILLAPAASSSAILSMGILCSMGAVVAASRLSRGYIASLESSLLNRAGDVDWSEGGDGATRSLALGAIRRSALAAASAAVAPAGSHDKGRTGVIPLDPEAHDILSLRSRDRDRVTAVLAREDGLTAALVPYAIPLLAWDPVAEHAVFALRKVAEDRVGQLVDALLDPNQDFAVRRRLARVFSVCVSQRAADGLMFGLEDSRFDVRYQSARSLASIVEKNAFVRIDGDRIYATVLREVAVGRPVWESRRLLEGFDEPDVESAADAFVRDRAGESLAHVFTLLSLVLQREPLQIAFRSLQTDDPQLQGTALEYLEGVLPPPIRQKLWPFLEPTPAKRPSVRGRDEILADLVRSNKSIMLNVEELRQAGFAPIASAV
jgi:AAA family ATP:ADP antiporter